MTAQTHSLRRSLSRRQVLRGAGVALALPFLDSLSPSNAHGQAARLKRFVSIYTPNGAPASWGDTTGTGPDFQLSALQAPFASVKSKLLMLRRLANFTWRRDLLQINWDQTETRNVEHCAGCVVPVGAYLTLSHARAAGAYSNCVDGDDWRSSNGESELASPKNAQTVDQIVADALGAATQYPSLQLGLFNGVGVLDQHHANLSREMSYARTGNPLNKRVDPQAVFDSIVGSEVRPDPAAAERRRALGMSALDAVKESLTQLTPRLGTADKLRLDQFLTSTRELENRISTFGGGSTCEATGQRPAPGIVLPGEVGYAGGTPEISAATMLARAHAMNDLLVMALRCDVTRVITYQLDNSRSDLVYSWLSLPNGSRVNAFHDETHVRWDPKPASPPGFEAISLWMNGVVADLVQKLDAVPDVDGSLLDNSVVMYGSDQHNADHAAWDLPIMLFGSGGGTFKQNELIELPTDISQMRQLRDFYFTLLNQYFELGVPSFGEDRRGLPNALLTEVLA